MKLCADFDALRPSAADVRVITSYGQSIAAHSYVLASASPVLERMIDRARRGWGADCTIRVLGVSFDAVRAFLHFLYSPKVAPDEEELVGAHGTQLLALAHAYRVGWLKRAAEGAVSARLTPERAVDMLKLDQRKERWARERAAQEACRQLGDAMASLDHIFPADGAVCAADAPCAKAGCTCRGLQLLMRHFATCAKKTSPGGCARCKRMLQLFRLHASVCDRPDQACHVPLCSHFKAKAQTEKTDKTWLLLVKKVTRAKVMSSLANRQVPEVVAMSWARYNGRVAKLR